MRIIANVKREPGEKNFSCYMNVAELKTSVLGLGSSAKAAIGDMTSGWQDAVADLKEDGIEVPELEIEYRFDVGSLFSYYDFVNIVGVAREIGVSPSVMRQYAIGIRKPSDERKAQIVNGFKSLAGKMQDAILF